MYVSSDVLIVGILNNLLNATFIQNLSIGVERSLVSKLQL